MVKGIAIILMFAHHLFAFPDRVPNDLPIISILFSSNTILERQVGEFGKICVGMFLFLSGFGLGIQRGGLNAPAWVKRLTSFYGLFWGNFVVLIGVSFLLFKDVSVDVGHWQGFDWSFRAFLLNFTILRPDYSMEWWFARLYLVVLAVVWPVCELLAKRGALVLIMGSLILYLMGNRISSPDSLLSWQPVFVFGFIAARFANRFGDECCGGLLPSSGRVLILAASLLWMSILLFLKNKLGDLWLIIETPLMVWISAKGFGAIPIVERVLALLGRHSANMWLNHTFICYYLMRDEFFKIRFSILMIFALLLLSFVVSCITMPLVKLICRIFEVARLRGFSLRGLAAR